MTSRSRCFAAFLVAMIMMMSVPMAAEPNADSGTDANFHDLYDLQPLGNGQWAIKWKNGGLDTALQQAESRRVTSTDRSFYERQLEIVTKIGVDDPNLPVSPEFFLNDIFSLEYMLGFLDNGIFRCLREHMAGMNDNIVEFDGLSELIDAYLNGTQPLNFEFESTSSETPENNTANLFGLADDDLFPEGFADPESGTPLDSACVELGIDETLDSSEPLNVVKAEIEFYKTGTGSIFGGPFDITSAFASPFDGRLSIVFTGLPGLDIDESQLRMEFEPQDIFADGFESGNTTSWTNSVD